MTEQIVQLTIVVPDYDEAIEFYTQVMGFELLEDTKRSETKRWVRVEPAGGGCGILLAKAVNAEQTASIGNQSGGRVFLFLHTDNFDAYYNRLSSHGVRFIGEPRDEDYGRVIVFLDLYGNKWDLIEPKV